MANGKYLEWSEGWIKEGHFLSYRIDGVEFHEHVLTRDLGHFVYDWPETVSSEDTSGPFTPSEIEITEDYNPSINKNRLWQLIFGISHEILLYLEIPSDIHRHGIPKVTKPSSDYRYVTHFTENMSTFREPSFITEHFMIKPEIDRITLSVYNPLDVDVSDFKLNFFFNKLETERIGEIKPVDGTLTPVPSEPHFEDAINRLWRRTIPSRPISLFGLRASARG